MHYCWGDNSCGQLGSPAGAAPGALSCRQGPRLGGQRLLRAACGERHSLLLLADGSVWACGSNRRGQLGVRGAGGGRPAQIQALETQKVVSVSCGKEHSLAISKTGSVFSWGAGAEGQLGNGEFKEQSFIPKKIQDLSGIKIIQVSCGHYHSIALAQDGRVFSWGNNSHGQLGLGKIFPSQASPQWVKSLHGIPLAQVAAGGAHSFALSHSCTSYGWGRNNAGQLALGGKNASVEQIYKPYSIGELKMLHVTYISCGDEHTAVLTKDGKVFTFGSNNYGQLGHRQVSNKSSPQIVDSDNLFSQIACGSYHTLAYSCTTGQVVSFGCGSQRDLNSPLQPDNLQENFNISNLISSSDFADVRVKDIFAGANANFVTTIQPKDVDSSYATERSQINCINQTLIKKWTTVEIGSEEFEDSKREIHEIFSHSACLTASFLKKRTDNTIPIDVDLQMSREVFKELIQKDWITRTITSCLRDDMLKNLPLDSSHQEALSIFLLLPECPIMHTSVNWDSLVVPFAKAVCKMRDQSSKVLENCWASLEESSFNSLIQMLKQTICFQLKSWCESDQSHSNTKALLGMLKKLHKVNMEVKYKVPENAFHINELLNYIDLHADLRRFYDFKIHPESSDATNSPVIFIHFPFIFNLLSKIRILDANTDLTRMKAQLLSSVLGTPPLLHLKVKRSQLVEDTLRQLNQTVDSDFKKELLVSFIGETNPEFGGVRKEFFHCVFKEMIQREYEMFICSEKSSLMWFPANPKFNKKNYFLFGILCGLSLVNFGVFNLPFPLALYKKLLDQKPSLEDLQELCPELGNNLKLLLDGNADDVEEFYLSFSIYWDKKDVDLVPNGSSVLVDKTNKKVFVSRCIDYIFNTSVKMIYEAFQMGFYKVCEKQIIDIFHPEELKEVMIGNPVYDWKSFEENSLYFQGYYKSHPTIVMFWEAFHRLSLEEKQAFLLFLTGSDRFQAQALRDVGIVFSYLEYLKEEDLPLVQTCDHVLFLPKYSTMERMEEALQIAIKNNQGFAH